MYKPVPSELVALMMWAIAAQRSAAALHAQTAERPEAWSPHYKSTLTTARLVQDFMSADMVEMYGVEALADALVIANKSAEALDPAPRVNGR